MTIVTYAAKVNSRSMNWLDEMRVRVLRKSSRAFSNHSKLIRRRSHISSLCLETDRISSCNSMNTWAEMDCLYGHGHLLPNHYSN